MSRKVLMHVIAFESSIDAEIAAPSSVCLHTCSTRVTSCRHCLLLEGAGSRAPTGCSAGVVENAIAGCRTPWECTLLLRRPSPTCRYRKASAQIFAIFKSVFPSATLEKASIDEAYLGANTVLAG
jgi:hypothetical protein